MARGKTALILLILILCVGAYLRLHLLSDQSLWDDEISTIEYTSKTPSEVWFDLQYRDANPSLFYVVYHYWRKIGDSAFVYRLFSVLFGFLSLPAMYLLSRRLLDPGPALAATLLLAVSPLAVYCSQEVRSHSMLLLLSILSVYFMIRCLDQGGIVNLLGSAVSTGLALHTHYFAFFLLGFEVLYAVVFAVKHLGHARQSAPGAQQLATAALEAPGTPQGLYSLVSLSAWVQTYRNLARGLIAFIVGVVLAGIAFLPWLKPFLTQMVTGGQSWRPYSPPWAIFKDVFIYFTIGHSATRIPSLIPPLEGLQDSAPFKFLVLIGCLLIPFAATAVLGLAKGPRRPDRGRLLLAMYLLVPLVLVILATQKIHLFDYRHMLPFLPAFCLLVARGLDRLASRSRAASLVLLAYIAALSLLSLGSYYHDPAYAKQNWRGAFEYIKQNAKPNDVILSFHHSKTLGLDFYSDQSIPILFAFPETREGKTLEEERELLRQRIDQIKSQAGRIWLFDYHGLVFDPLNLVRGMLKEDRHMMDFVRYSKGVRTFTLELFTPDFQEARATYKPAVDFSLGQQSEAQLLSGWYHLARQSRIMAEEGSVILSADGGFEAAAPRFYAHYPFFGEKPFTVHLLVEDAEVASVTVDRQGVFDLRGPIPADLLDADLLRVTLRSEAWFRPADILDVPDTTRKSIAVFFVRLE